MTQGLIYFAVLALLNQHIGVTLAIPPTTLRNEFDVLKRKYPADKPGLYRTNFALTDSKPVITHILHLI